MLSHSSAPSPESSISSCIESCRRLLKGVSETPWLDARILASFVTGLDASAVVAYGDVPLGAKRRSLLFSLARRRAQGEPVAYIVGAKDFCGLRLTIDRRVLVPRPETEALVMTVVDQWLGKGPHILDLGTGSGAIACALAHLLPRCRVLATDISRDALAVARENIQRLALGERVRTEQGDLFDAVPEQQRFDVIVANLPYVEDCATSGLAQAVRDHEPPTALFGGRGGSDVYRRMLPAAPQYLSPGGMLCCECGPHNAAEVAALMQNAFPAADVSVGLDLAGLERMVTGRLGKAIK